MTVLRAVSESRPNFPLVGSTRDGNLRASGWAKIKTKGKEEEQRRVRAPERGRQTHTVDMHGYRSREGRALV